MGWTGIPIDPHDAYWQSCDVCLDQLPASFSVRVFVGIIAWIGEPPNPLPLTFEGTVFQNPDFKWQYTGGGWMNGIGVEVEIRFCQQPDNYLYMVLTGLDIECNERFDYNHNCFTDLSKFGDNGPCRYQFWIGGF